MLGHLRAVPPRAACSLSCLLPNPYHHRYAHSTPEPTSEPTQAEEPDKSDAQASNSAHGYEVFLKGAGRPFEKATRPRNWLGGNVPFPMNPTFKPPSPISDSLRTEIYGRFMADPEKNSVRELAQRYHLSIKRVDAILRLKGQEESWVKQNELQTGFLAGMEMLLGVEQDEAYRKKLYAHELDYSRHDVSEADSLEQEEGRDRARQRYQRLFWESVPEGSKHEPIVPAELERAQEENKTVKKAAEKYKSSSQVMHRFEDTPNDKVRIVSKPGRPSIKFVDVGGKFIDVDDRLHRNVESKRRAMIKKRHKADAHHLNLV